MATGICFHELALIAEMTNQEHCLLSCMRANGEPPEQASEIGAYVAGLSQIAMLIPVMRLAALELEIANSQVVHTYH